MRFILVHRYINNKEDVEITYVNIDNINTFSACSDGKGTRIAMRDSFILVEEDTGAILNKIRWEEINSAR